MTQTNNLFDDLFQPNSSCYHENTRSTFSTLPKPAKRDLSSSINKGQNQPILTDLPQTHFPTLQTVLNQTSKDNQPKFPQPPPLLKGILFLDQIMSHLIIRQELVLYNKILYVCACFLVVVLSFCFFFLCRDFSFCCFCVE
jgi:hypothetical protein